MEEDYFLNFPLTNSDNDSSSMDNSASDMEEYDDHKSDDQIYYDEESSQVDEYEGDDDDIEEYNQTDYDAEPSQGEELEEEDDRMDYNNESSRLEELEEEDELIDYQEAIQEVVYEQDEDNLKFYTLDNQEEVAENEEHDESESEEGEVFYQPSKKWPRVCNLDRISNLSDDTILHILSFLPMKDAVKTGTLSKRWKHLWTGSSTLIFKNGCFDDDKILSFVDFVNYTLQLCTCHNIRKFVLEFAYASCYATWVDRWIRYLTQRRAQDVHIRFLKADQDRYELPQHLFTNSSLRVLSLSNCVFEPSGDISWRSLTSLSLENMDSSDELVSKILSGSPVLEFLKISSCAGVSFLGIRSKSLKELVIKHTFHNFVDMSDETVLEISAPHLKSLDLLGSFYKRRCRLVNVASLVKANFGFNCANSRNYDDRHSYLFHLLRKLRRVEKLELGTWCIEVLSTVQPNEFHFSELRCKNLTLRTNLKNSDFYRSVEILLCNSPCLETLKVDMGSSHKYYFDKGKKNYGKKLKRKVSAALLSHLKTVQIINFSPSHEEFVLRLVKLILENAKELEKMVIETGKSGYYKWSSCMGSHRFIQLTRKIMSYPRCSPKAVILM